MKGRKASGGDFSTKVNISCKTVIVCSDISYLSCYVIYMLIASPRHLRSSHLSRRDWVKVAWHEVPGRFTTNPPSRRVRYDFPTRVCFYPRRRHARGKSNQTVPTGRPAPLLASRHFVPGSCNPSGTNPGVNFGPETVTYFVKREASPRNNLYQSPLTSFPRSPATSINGHSKV